MATLQTLPDATTFLPQPVSPGLTTLAARSFFYAVFKHSRLVVGTFLLIFLATAVSAVLRPSSWRANTKVLAKLGEQHVYVGGEVARPGLVVLRPEMTPLQAVLQTGGFRPTAKLNSVLIMTPAADGRFSAARVDMKQVVNDGVPERVRLHPNDVIYVPPTWIADMDTVVDQYVRGLIPSLPRVGAGYSLSN